MRCQVSKRAQLLLASLCGFLLAPAGALAEGFGTPSLDGLLTGDEAIYNAAEAADSLGDAPQGFTNLDLGTLYVANDNTFWYFLFTIGADISLTNWGKYILFIDTTNDGAGAPDDSSSTWARDIAFTSPHLPEYALRSWVDNPPYDGSDSQWHSWNGTTWVDTGTTADGAALNAASLSGIEWKISKAKLGSPSTLWCEVISTGGTAGDPAQDTVNDPAEDWNATNWNDTSTILVSTQVAEQSGMDTTPPTLASGNVRFVLGAPGTTNQVDLTFSEPMNGATLANPANYADLGGKTVNSAIVTGQTTVRLTLSSNYGFGVCEQIRVTGVQDLAGNIIADNGTTNVTNFHLYQLHMRGRMNLHMAADPGTTGTHTVGWEGGRAPLTWDPTCDLLLTDLDADSTWTQTLNFTLPCSTGTGGAEVSQLEYKLSHGVDGGVCHYEAMGGNHFYDFNVTNQPDGADTVEIWWDDQAPVDFTDKDIDVVFKVQSAATQPPFAAADSVALAGSETPLTWNAMPPDNFMADDGVAPDETADDGIYSARMTFPTGTLKNVQFKYLANLAADSLGFVFECQGGPGGSSNRNVFLNDSLFSTGNPIVLDVAYFDDCDFVTGVEDIVDALLNGVNLEASRPNPLRTSAIISYTLPARGEVRLDVYDVRGRKVRSLVDEVRPEGRQSVVWDGRTDSRAVLPNGIYFYRLRTAEGTVSRKILLMR